MKIIHIITGLNDGGAESVLFRLCERASEYQHMVISLSDEGKYAALLRNKGIEVFALGMSAKFPSPFAFFKLVKLIKRYNPDVIQTWMYHADLLGSFASRIAGINKIAWGIRHSILERGKSKMTTIWIAKILSRLSWWLPSQIAVNAQRSIESHVSLGYDRSKMCLIPNGYDVAFFQSKPKVAQNLRAEWGIEQNVTLIGTVGRYNPHKDHNNLLEALSILRSRKKLLRCVLVGKNLDYNNKALVKEICRFGLEKMIKLIGPRDDMPEVMSAFDIHVLPSMSEGFPNVVAEAMACETPCIVTDVGDSAHIVGNTGWVVKPRNPQELADVIDKASIERFRDDWIKRCSAARNRIENEFSIEKMVSNYSAFWKKLQSP